MGVSYNVPLREDQIFEKAKGDIDRQNLATLTSAIHSETENRQNADANLQADIAALSTALSDEITLRANDDYALKQEYTAKITQEAITRQEDDAALRTAISNEVLTRNTQTASLGSALQNEVTARTNADNAIKSELNANLSNEAALRASEDNKLNAKIDALRESIPEQQTLNIKDFTPSSATQDGAAGLVPAPPKSTQKQLLTNQGWEELSSTDIFIGAVPSQSGQPSYTGSVIYPQWLNYDEQKLTIAGQFSGTNVGTYTVTFTPRGLYCWNDGTRNARTVTWQIYKATVPVPTAAITSYEFTGNNITLSVTNFDSAKINQAGTVTAKNAGSYTATYKLKDTANYTWADGSITDKNISWNITAKKLAKPYASNTQLNYTGAAVTLSVSNVDLTYMNKAGSDTATAAGTYSVTYTLKDTTNYQWSDGSTSAVTINWEIVNSSLAKPTAAVTSFDYTGSQITLNITGFDASTMTKSGNDSAINAGTYSVKFVLKDKASMKWADGTTADVVISWTINRKKLTAAQSTFSIGEASYNGETKYLLMLINYKADYHLLTGEVSAINAGTYTGYVEPRPNYCWSDESYNKKTLVWTITKKQIAKPTAAKTAFDYDGAVKTLSFSNYNSALMTKAGTDSASAKGSYTVTFTLNDTTNYCWADNTTAAVTITWSIGASAIAKPTLSGTTAFTYDGNAKTVTVNGYDSNTMTFSGTISETNAGNYTAKYSLKDKTNYAWTDGTTADVVLSWSIARKKLTAAQSNLSCKVTEKTVHVYEWDANQGGGLVSNIACSGDDINNFDATYHTITRKSKTAGNFNTDVLFSCSVNLPYADEFIVGLQSNYCWSDGSTEPKTFPVTVKQLKIPKPSASTTSFKYDGTTKNLTVSNYDSVYMTRTGDISGTNVGSYSVTYSFKSYRSSLHNDNGITPYVVWSDDNTDNDVIINWQITTGDGIAKPTLSKTEYEWTGGNISPSVSGYNSASMNQGGTYTASAIGTYTVTYSLKDKANTKWADGTTADVTLTWKVVRQKLANELAIDTGTTLTYNGSSQEPKFKYGTVQWTLANLSQYCDLSSQTSAVDAGTYKIVVTPKSTYAFKDGTTAAKTYSWTINKITVAVPTITNTTFTYDGNEHSPTLSAYDTSLITASGTSKETNAGSYQITLSLKNTTSYVWAGNSTADKVFDWTISAKGLLAPSLTGTTTFTYDGTSHSVSYINFDAATMTVEGTLSATNANTYDVTFKLKNYPNYRWTGSGEMAYQRTASWVIEQATPEISIDTTEFTLDNNSDGVNFTVTYNGDGELVCEPYVGGSNKIVSAGWVAGKTAYISTLDFGEATVLVFARAGQNYKQSASIYITVHSHYVKPLNECSWSKIKELLATGYAANVWKPGDYVNFSFERNMPMREGTTVKSVSDFPTTAILLGIDHNTTYEKPVGYSHYADFVISAYANTGNLAPILFDSVSYDNDSYEDEVDSYTVNTYNIQVFRYGNDHWADTLFSALPSGLRNVIITPTKYFTRPNRVESTPTIQKPLWSLDVMELPRFNTFPYNGTRIQRYEYFLNGNYCGGIIPNPVSTNKYWTRSALYDGHTPTCVSHSGTNTVTITSENENRKLSILPCFRIGG